MKRCYADNPLVEKQPQKHLESLGKSLVFDENLVFAFVVLFFAISMPTKVLWANGRLIVCEKEEYDKASIYVCYNPSH